MEVTTRAAGATRTRSTRRPQEGVLEGSEEGARVSRLARVEALLAAWDAHERRPHTDVRDGQSRPAPPTAPSISRDWLRLLRAELLAEHGAPDALTLG